MVIVSIWEGDVCFLSLSSALSLEECGKVSELGGSYLDNLTSTIFGVTKKF